MKTFSDHAHNKMIELYNNHAHEVGSELKKSEPVKYKSFESTDCITYSLNVLSYAFKKMGDNTAASQVWKLGKHGTSLAKYLVDTHRWKGIYVNPDSIHPTDADSEHSYTSHLATKTCKYYKVPLEYKIHNYTPTAKTDSSFQKINKNSGLTTLNSIDIASLDQVKFGFGLSRGGMHTWMFSEGKIYEVHWNSVGAGLYEATNLRLFPWLSGIIVVPADQANHLAISAKLKCGS